MLLCPNEKQVVSLLVILVAGEFAFAVNMGCLLRLLSVEGLIKVLSFAVFDAKANKFDNFSYFFFVGQNIKCNFVA